MSASYTLTVGPEGRVLLPKTLRQEAGIEPGTKLVARVENGAVVLTSRVEILRGLRGSLKADASVVDELIADRGREAAGEL